MKKKKLNVCVLSGTAVITSRIGGIPDIVEDGKSGCLVPAGDVEALAGKIQDLLSNDRLRQRLIQNGGESVQEKYHLPAMASRCEKIYRAMRSI